MLTGCLIQNHFLKYPHILGVLNAPVTLQIKVVANQQNVTSYSRLLEVAGILYTVAIRFHLA